MMRDGDVTILRSSIIRDKGRWAVERIGAGDRDRTGDIQLGKLAFYR
jgi:hypothetical protein